MKPFLIPLFFAGLLLASCNQEVKKENKRLKTENQELSQKVATTDSSLELYVNTFEEVQANLDSIRQREETIRKARTEGLEGATNIRKAVLQDITAINELLDENKQKLKKLSEQLGARNQKLASLQRLVANLRTQNEDKDEEIATLKQELEALNFKMDQLNNRVGALQEENMAQQNTIEQQKASLNAVYYLVGTDDELEEKGVINKKGGFIGIGKTKTLAGDLSKEAFTKAHKKKLQQVKLNLDNDKAVLISEHPERSYQWNKTDDGHIQSLQITDKQAFWKVSPFLVIQVKN